MKTRAELVKLVSKEMHTYEDAIQMLSAAESLRETIQFEIADILAADFKNEMIRVNDAEQAVRRINWEIRMMTEDLRAQKKAIQNEQKSTVARMQNVMHTNLWETKKLIEVGITHGAISVSREVPELDTECW